MAAVTDLATPVAIYIEAYAAGDRDTIASVFADDASITYNNLAPSIGLQAIKDSHVQAGRFRYVVERAYHIDNVTMFEGQMYGVKDGAPVESVPIAISGVAELSLDGQKIRAMRIYYDGNRVGKALEAMKA